MLEYFYILKGDSISICVYVLQEGTETGKRLVFQSNVDEYSALDL